MNEAVLKAAIILAYGAFLGRTPETQAVIDQYAAAAQPDGSKLDAVIAQIANSPEALQHRARIDGVLGLIGGQLAAQDAVRKAYGLG